MDAAFMVCSKDYWPNAKICFRTLSRVSNCSVFLCCHGWIDGNVKLLGRELRELFPTMEIFLSHISDEKWHGQRMSEKVHALNRIFTGEMADNMERLLSLDADMVFKADPFSVFDDNPEADIIITKRGYRYYYPINAGLWGLRKNSRSKRFLGFFSEQLTRPTWRPFVYWLKRFGHHEEKDWYIDQDFLCTVYENGLPFDCNVAAAGCEWNFCPDNRQTDLETAMAEAEKNPGIKVLHYKSTLKQRMIEVWGREER